jgi:phosphoglycerol transferase MdoB-like AlkP superfamily enzyme
MFSDTNGTCLTLSQIQTIRQIHPSIEFKFNYTLEGVLIRDFINYSSPGATIAIVWVVLFLILLIISLVDLTIYRDTVVYRTSSPLFCALIGLGIVAIYVSIFGWIGKPTAALCAMRPWLAGVGFVRSPGFISRHRPLLIHLFLF